MLRPHIVFKCVLISTDLNTGPDGAVVMSSANGLGSYLSTGSNPERVFKFNGPMGRCMATTPSSLSLTSNRVTTNY